MVMNLYYKLTNSYNESIYASRDKVIYEVGKWARPTIPHSFLFAFDSLEAVKEFVGRVKYGESYLLYECDVKAAFYPKEKIAILSHDFRQYWIDASELVSTREVPKGTVMCKSIRLNKLITM